MTGAAAVLLIGLTGCQKENPVSDGHIAEGRDSAGGAGSAGASGVPTMDSTASTGVAPGGVGASGVPIQPPDTGRVGRPPQ
jgi:hypothetical protein